MSAIVPKQTPLVAPHMSAIGGNAGMLFCLRRQRQRCLIQDYWSRSSKQLNLLS